MKKNFLYILFLVAVNFCYAQNSDIHIKHLHSANGKEWKRYVRPDGPQVAKSLEDDVFIFFSDGTFKYDHSGTVSQELNNSRTKTWSYDKQTNIVSWELYLSNGKVKKYKGELAYLDDKRAVMNFSEDGGLETIVVLITDSFIKP